MNEIMLKFVELSFKYWEDQSACTASDYLGIDKQGYNHEIHFPQLIAKHSYELYRTVSEYWDGELHKSTTDSLK